MADSLTMKTFRKITFLECVVILIIMNSEGYSINDTDTLYKSLLQDYNKHTRGINNQNEIVYLSLFFNLVSINEFDEVAGKFSVVGFFEMYWQDERMVWDPDRYNGVEYIFFPSASVWKPIIVVGNPQNGIMPIGTPFDDFLIGFSPYGEASWHPGDLFQFACVANVIYYPYDSHTCIMEFVPWDYTSEFVQFHLLKEKVDMTFFEESNVWLVESTHVWIELLEDSSHTLNVEVVLKRRSLFYLINMILPVAGLNLLNIFVFLIPPESGERVGYSITVLLAIAVFQTITSDNLPKSSHPDVSGLCFKLLADFIISGIVMIFTIISLRIYHKDQLQPVPKWLCKATNCLVCRSKCKNNKDEQIEENYIKGHRAEFVWTPKEREGNIARNNATTTWADVGKLMDVVFTVFSLLAFVVSSVGFIIYINHGTT